MFNAMVTRWLCVAAAVLISSLGKAQAPKSNEDRSYRLYLEADQAYKEGQAARAVELLNEAYRRKPEPVLLYNLARAYEALGKLAEAADYYSRYILAEPTAAGRGNIINRIAALKAQIVERERLTAERQLLEQELKEAQSPRAAVPMLAWVLTGVGVAGVGGGASFKGVALRLREDAQADPVHASATATFARGRDFDTASSVLLLAGAAIVAGGIAWATVAWWTRQKSPPVMATLGPGMVTFTWRGP